MPKLRANSWRAYRLDSAPLRPDDHTLIRRYLAWRTLRTSSALAKREERWIVRWLCFLAERGLGFADAQEADALDLAAQWDSWGWTASPRQHFIAALRTFYDYLMDRGLAERNPWARIRGPRPRDYTPPVLTPEEITRLEDALDRHTWRDIRDRAVICLISASACRISEALRLDVGDLDLPNRRFLIRGGKGNRDRMGFLNEKAAKAVELYLRTVRPLLTGSPTGPLFLGARGGRLQGEIVREALRRARRRAGLARHVWPHLLRHSTATEFLDGGAGLEQVQALLGHVSIASTRRYVRVAQSRLRRAYDQIIGRRDERARAGA
jgi:integrase/recombinase XerC